MSSDSDPPVSSSNFISTTTDPQPSPSHHMVTEVDGASETYRRLAASKPTTAEWVAGLRPEDELAEIVQLQLRKRLEQEALERARREAATASGRGDRRRALTIGGTLRWQGALLLVACLCAATIQALYRSPALVNHTLYALQEEAMWPYATAHTDLWTDYVLPLAVPAGTLSIALLCLCWRAAVLSDSFAIFCGIGAALLALLSSVVDVVLLYNGCKEISSSFPRSEQLLAEEGVSFQPHPNTVGGPQHDCHIPFVSHWFAMLLPKYCLQLALMSVCFLLDYLSASSFRRARAAQAGEAAPPPPSSSWWRIGGRWLWCSALPLGLWLLVPLTAVAIAEEHAVVPTSGYSSRVLIAAASVVRSVVMFSWQFAPATTTTTTTAFLSPPYREVEDVAVVRSLAHVAEMGTMLVMLIVAVRCMRQRPFGRTAAQATNAEQPNSGTTQHLKTE